MKKIKILVAIVTFSLITPAVFANNNNPVLKTKLDSLNYVLGLTTGGSLKNFYLQNDSTREDDLKMILKGIEVGMKEYSEFETLGKNVGSFLKKSKENGLMDNKNIPIEFDIIKQAIVNGLRGFEKTMLETDAKEYLESTMQELQKKQQEELYGENKKAGEDFLLENAKKEGVHTTESGLQYEIIKEGKGEKPTETSSVKVHYHGTLLDGTVFDSSVDRGTPAEFPVNGVIKGWTEALQLMPAGSKWKLYIPYDLAYGEREAGPIIKPFSMLIFEVELLSVAK